MDSTASKSKQHNTSEDIHIEDYFITGSLYLIYPIKIEDFIEEIVIYSDGNILKKLKEPKEISNYVNRFRGTEAFERFCGKDSVISKEKEQSNKTEGRNLKKKEPDEKKDKDRKVRENGYHYSTFRRNLTDQWLSVNTKHIHPKEKENYQIPDEETFEFECDYYVRLSYYGIVELRKEIKLENTNFFTLQKFLLGLKKELTDAQSDSPNPLLSSSWDYVKNIFAEFINSELHGKTTGKGNEYLGKYYKIISQCPSNNGNETVTNEVISKIENGSEFVLKSKDKIKKDTLKRQRYAVILTDNIKYKNTPLKNIEIDTELVRPLIRSILEGSLKKTNKGKYILPRMRNEPFTDLKNLSTWEKEFCFMGTERAFIYFEHTELTYTDNDENVHPYKDYWEGIVRGIEHTVSVTALLKILHKQTTEYLCDVPILVRRFDEINRKSFDINAEKNEERALEQRKKLESQVNELHKDLFEFARKVSNISNIVPKVRDICIPSSAFRSGMVVEKFEYLNEKCFNISTILKNMTDNLNELSDFLLFFQQQQLLIRINEAGNKVEEKNLNLGMIASLLTFASIIYVSASFWNDFYTFIQNKCFVNGCGRIDLKAVIAVLSYLGILILIYILFKNTLKDFKDSFIDSLRKNWITVSFIVFVYFLIILIFARFS